LQNSAFISLNYDILIDNALTLFYNEVDVDYGIHFTDFDKAESLMYQDDNEIWKMPRKDRSIFLLKPHGSLNWLYCPTCLKVSLFPLEKKVSKLKWEPGECVCEKCKTLQVPILIPPTFFKVMSNYFLQQVWRLSEEKVLNADRIIFCGYSFPDADLHIKYLLKRAEINSDLLKEVYIVNEHKEKKNEERDLEKWRYQRFFHCGKTQVRYTDISFEEYANNPELILSPVRWK